MTTSKVFIRLPVWPRCDYSVQYGIKKYKQLSCSEGYCKPPVVPLSVSNYPNSKTISTFNAPVEGLPVYDLSLSTKVSDGNSGFIFTSHCPTLWCANMLGDHSGWRTVWAPESRAFPEQTQTALLFCEVKFTIHKGCFKVTTHLYKRAR